MEPDHGHEIEYGRPRPPDNEADSTTALEGRINLSSPDHVSLLVHKTFNVSIPRHHIPMDEWEFEYGPAENDPEFAEAKEEAEGDAEAKAEGDDDAEKDEQEDSGSGRWVHRSTGERLGGSTGILQFTVIGCVLLVSYPSTCN